jgi:hypothetical protein
MGCSCEALFESEAEETDISQAPEIRLEPFGFGAEGFGICVGASGVKAVGDVVKVVLEGAGNSGGSAHFGLGAAAPPTVELMGGDRLSAVHADGLAGPYLGIGVEEVAASCQ